MSQKLRLEGKRKKTTNRSRVAVLCSGAVAALGGLALILSPIMQTVSAISITSLSRTSGSAAGGDTITISGSGFIEDTDDRIMQFFNDLQSLALTASGKVFSWGENNHGELGTGDYTNYNTPQDITAQFGSEKVTQIASGTYFSLALTASGKVFTWGINREGQLGTGDNTSYNTPQDITAQFGSEEVTQISGGNIHSLALTASGKVFSWGDNNYGQLGTGDNTNYNTPQNITAQFGSSDLQFLHSGMTTSPFF